MDPSHAAPATLVPTPAAPASVMVRPTPAERRADAVVHVLGLSLAAVAAPGLVVAAVMLDGRGATVAGVAVYAAGLVAMLAFSAAYHLMHQSARRELLRRCDHAAIYLKIAATQTPFAVLIGGGGSAWLIGSVWATALGAAAGKLAAPDLLRRVSLPLYLALGWAGALLLWPRAEAAELAAVTVALMTAGGLLYTVGVPFFLSRRLLYANAVWHAFVLAATVAFYAAVASELAARAAG